MMYELEVIVDVFKDIRTKKEYKKGDKFKCDKQRGASLIVKGICKLVAEIKEDANKENENKEDTNTKNKQK
ncbi:hypothetical protein IJD44_07870 [bacterium]|nr:hypothetical protein [bacterium]